MDHPMICPVCGLPETEGPPEPLLTYEEGKAKLMQLGFTAEKAERILREAAGE